MTEALFKFRWQETVCGRGYGAPKDLTSTERLVALALSTWMDADGAGARPGISRLCRAAGFSKRDTVIAALAALERKGYLECIHRGGRGAAGASVYVGRFPASLVTVGNHPGHLNGLGLVTSADQPGHPGGTPSIQDQSRGSRARARGAPCPVCGVGNGLHAEGFDCLGREERP